MRHVSITILGLLSWTVVLTAQMTESLRLGKSIVATNIRQPNLEKPIYRIAMGSCGYQDLPQPILRIAADWNPDVFLFLGDNIYGDTENMDTLRAKYNRLGSKPEFKRLAERSPILAVWDDHDYGVNDGGEEYPKKAESKDIFLQFWNEPQTSARRSHAGIYHSMVVGPVGKRTQFIMVDNRTFRSPVVPGVPGKDINDYIVDTNRNARMLGDMQWAWLEEQLRQPAEVRIFMTSTQFVSEFNGYELWALKPFEKQRMIDLISKTNASGVIFVSGDVHFGELSVQKPTNTYPLYDLTASGITSTDFPQPNKYRVAKQIHENHFGTISIDWAQADPAITFEIYNVVKDAVFSRTIKLSEISFAKR